MKHVISINQFKDKKQLQNLFDRAKEFSQAQQEEYSQILANKTIATMFYEPSTRTRLSFEAAVQNLGANLISTENAGSFSSAIKGETIEDSVIILSGYAQAIVMRHPEIGSAERAASASQAPIINAGDGAGEHPTQALLDLYTIFDAKGSIDGLRIGLVGDLLNGRTIHSLIQVLSLYDVELFFIAPKELQLSEKYMQMVNKSNVKYAVLENWDEALDKLDVIYMTRVQKERFSSIKDYNRVKDSFILDKNVMKKLNQNAIIMHPLPRVNEITTDVDKDPRAYYFKQARNGLFVRMALLELLLKD